MTETWSSKEPQSSEGPQPPNPDGINPLDDPDNIADALAKPTTEEDSSLNHPEEPTKEIVSQEQKLDDAEYVQKYIDLQTALSKYRRQQKQTMLKDPEEDRRLTGKIDQLETDLQELQAKTDNRMLTHLLERIFSEKSPFSPRQLPFINLDETQRLPDQTDLLLGVLLLSSKRDVFIEIARKAQKAYKDLTSRLRPPSEESPQEDKRVFEQDIPGFGRIKFTVDYYGIVNLAQKLNQKNIQSVLIFS